jgi:hypothetical protein
MPVATRLREACAIPEAGSDFSLKDWGKVKIERVERCTTESLMISMGNHLSLALIKVEE